MPYLSEKPTENLKQSIAITILMSIAAKGLGFILQLTIVYFFGAGGSTDVYFWCLTFIMALLGLVSSINSSVVVPHSLNLLNCEGTAALRGFLVKIMRIYLSVSVALTAVLVAFPFKSAEILSKFDGRVLAENQGLIRVTLLSLPAMVMTVMMIDVFAIQKVFSATVVTEVLKGAAVLGVFLGLRPFLGSISIAYAFLIGSLLQFTILWSMLKSRVGWNLLMNSPKLPGKVKADITITLLGQSSTVVLYMATAFLISGFEVGIYSSMNCALSMIGLIQLLLITKICYVVGISFVDLYSQNRKKELNALFLNYLKPALLVIFIIAPLSYGFSDDLMHIAFQRGNFHASDVHVTARFFRIFILTMPLILIEGFVTQLVFAAKKIGSAIYLQLLFNMTSILMIWLLVDRYGYIGYPMGMLLVHVPYIAVLWIYSTKVFAFLEFKSILLYLAGNTATLLATGVVVWPLRSGHVYLFAVAYPIAILLALGVWEQNRVIMSRFASLMWRWMEHA